jgi:hypothetical protein
MESGILLLGVATTKYFYFYTTNPDTKLPVTLAGTPSLGANINGGAEVTAGLTLSVDHGGITGRHRVAVEVDNVTLALADADDFDIYVKQGTVGGYDVAGAPLASYECSDGTLPDINTEVDTAISDAALATAANLAIVDGIVDSILVDTAEIGTAGAGLTNINLPNQTMDIVGNITGSLSGSVGSVTGAVGSVTGNVGGNVTGSVGSLATQAKADVNAEVDTALADYDAPTNAELTTAVDALPTAAENAAALLDLTDGIETSITPRQALRAMLASVAGVLSGASEGSTEVTIKNPSGGTTRLTVTVDEDGNRSAVVTNL